MYIHLDLSSRIEVYYHKQVIDGTVVAISSTSLGSSDVFGKRLDYFEDINHTNQFDMSNYAPGTYLINIMPDNLIFQIIKQ